MKPYYKYIEHTADVLFEAYGSTLEELFVQCALALEETQVNVEKIECKQETIISGKSKDVESLLFDFLDDLVYYKDAELLVFSKFKIKIEEKGDVCLLNCICSGEKLDFKKHDPRVDVKAVTMHMFKVEKINDGWKAKVLLDI